MERRKVARKAKRVRSSSGSSSSGDGTKKQWYTEEEKTWLREYMAGIREEFAMLYPVFDEDFTCGPRGAPSNRERGKPLFDTSRTEACSVRGKKFLADYGPPQSFSLTWSEHEREPSNIICYAHHLKLNYLFGHYLENGGGALDFTNDFVNAWVPEDRFTELMGTPTLKRSTATRGREVLNLRPGPYMDSA